MITTSNSINFNSYENNSKITNQHNQKKEFFEVNNEINLNLKSVTNKNDNINKYYDYNSNDYLKDPDEIYSSNINIKGNDKNNNNCKIDCIIDHPIKIEFLNRKRLNKSNFEANDLSKIKNDLCPDTNYQGYKIIHNDVPKFSENFLSYFQHHSINNLSNENEIVDELKINILKNNLLNNKNINDSEIEKQILKEIFFHQFYRLFCSKDNFLIKSFILKKINELILEDNIEDYLLLLRKIQVFKNKTNNKRELKKENLFQIIELISNNNFMHPVINECNIFF